MFSTLQATVSTENASTYTAVPVFRFMRPAYEMHLDGELLVSLNGSTMQRRGEIVVGDACYQIDCSTMRQADGADVAAYRVFEGFMRFTRVKIVEHASQREFELRQKRMWCGTAVLSESAIPLAELSQKLFQSQYRIVAKQSVPEPVLLLSVWLAGVAGVFSA